MKKIFDKKRVQKSERGQAIVLIVFAFIGLIAAVGLVTDTGLLMAEYGRLKRSVDAAAVAAAQEFRPDPDTGDLNMTAMENAALGMLQINQMQNVRDIIVHTCEDTGPDRPELCNPNPDTDPINNRKLVEVTATADVQFAFMRVLGINSAELTVTSIGEAATIDLVLLIDTSGSMSYETTDADGDPNNQPKSDPGDDPRLCNDADTCQPMRAVKDVAMEFVDSLIYFGYDRVSVIAMTEQAADINDAVMRDPVEVLPLSFDRGTIMNDIDHLKVFQPRICGADDLIDPDHPADPEYPNPPGPGECLKYAGLTYEKSICPQYEKYIGPAPAAANPSSCPSSNIGGMLALAKKAFSGSGDPEKQRTESLWVTVLMASGPANASTGDPDTFPNGYCPEYTWFFNHPSIPDPKPRWCRDGVPSNERDAGDPPVSFTNPYDSNQIISMSYYDAEDYARDMADQLAAMKSGNGVTIYTVGLGKGVSNMPAGFAPAVTCQIDRGSGPEPCGEAEHVLTYVAQTAGDALAPSMSINHGDYFYAPNNVTLRNIFEIIAQNIATKISQ